MRQDAAIYTRDGSLLFEPERDAVRAVAEGVWDSVPVTVSTMLSLREAIKARRALSRTIRCLKERQECGVGGSRR